MNELDRERIIGVKAWATNEIERIEIRRANAPLWGDFHNRTHELMTKGIPEIMADPRAAVRNTVSKLESSLRDSNERQAQAEEGRRRRLARARARTNALREWLEALS